MENWIGSSGLVRHLQKWCVSLVYNGGLAEYGTNYADRRIVTDAADNC